jgi:uncharacterized BrkB/YihY/UPF0761 family membrane protein
MPVNIIHEYPDSNHLRRFLSRLARLLGALLVLCSLITFIPLLLIMAAAIWSAVDGTELKLDSQDIPFFAGATILTIGFFFLGRRLMRGRRQLVLFLRRFGFVGATEALTFALATAIGSSWRLVTLDDHQIAPVGPGKKIRWTSVIVGLFAGALAVAAVFWLFNKGLDGAIKSGFDQAGRSNNIVASIIGGIFLALILALVLVMVVIIPAAFLAVISIFSFGSYLSVRRAERSKTAQVASLQKIDPMARKVVSRTRRVLSPKLIVVRVAGTVWQETVRRLALVSAAVVIDVSEPTTNLLWEIETLKPDLRPRWILVAEQQHLNGFATMTGQNLTVNRRLFELLDGEDILVYSIDREGKKRFARALRGKLDGMSSSPPKALRA